MGQQILISGHPAIKGNHEFLQEEMFGLKPGEQIIKIGRLNKNGKESSSCRIMEFTMPVTYRGTFQDEEGKYMAIEVPAEGVKRNGGWDLFNQPEAINLLFAILDETEIILQNFDSCSIKIFKPVFERVN